MLRVHGIAISMDGRGRFNDNIFVERLWRSLKYEDVYLKAYQDVGEARRSIAAYFEFYNHERLHQALDYRTPRQVFEEALQVAKPQLGIKAAPWTSVSNSLARCAR
jgi:putative transposase